MKWLFICVLVVVIDQYNCAKIPESHFGKGLQIGSADDKSFTLIDENLKILLTMLEADDVKDRELVVVSIAGTLNLGKSFLMNFFIRYLESIQNGNETDWCRKGKCMSGFDWGENRTKGISVWHEIFKITLPNGKKVAIVLLDTQGLNSIKNQSFNKDARIFAFSVMASSAQCYNVLRDLTSLDLGALDLFTGYGCLANENKAITKRKQFQNLNVIVRDKPSRMENFKYGRQRDEVKNEYLGILPNDTDAKEEQTKRIYNYYENIDLFYMPSPGEHVTQNAYYDGNLTEVKQIFIDEVKELSEFLFAPNNLVVKRVDGEPIKAKDFVTYLKSYGKMLNSTKLPDLSTYFQNILNIKYKSWQEEGLKLYEKSMQDQIKTCNPTNDVSYFSDGELQQIHTTHKNVSMEKFTSHKALNTDNYIQKYITALEKEIDRKYNDFFKDENKRNKECFKSKLKSFYADLVKNITDTYDAMIIRDIRDAAFIDDRSFDELKDAYIKNATAEFKTRDKYKKNPKYEEETAKDHENKLEIEIRKILDKAGEMNRLKKQAKLNSSIAIRSDFTVTSLLVVVAIFNSARHLT